MELIKQNKDVQELKTKIEKGTISYFSLSKEENLELRQIFKEQIKSDKQKIESIRNFVKAEKKRLKNNI